MKKAGVSKDYEFGPNIKWVGAPASMGRDKILHLREKGLFIVIATHSSNYNLTIERIAEQCADGVGAIKASIRKLEKAGYLKRERAENNKTWYSLRDSDIAEVLHRQNGPVDSRYSESAIPSGGTPDIAKALSRPDVRCIESAIPTAGCSYHREERNIIKLHSPSQSAGGPLEGQELPFSPDDKPKDIPAAKPCKWDRRDESCAKRFFSRVKEHRPNSTISYSAKWPASVEKLRRVYGMTYRQINEMMDFIIDDEFWFDNAQSLPALLMRSKTNGLLKFDNVRQAMTRKSAADEPLCPFEGIDPVSTAAYNLLKPIFRDNLERKDPESKSKRDALADIVEFFQEMHKDAFLLWGHRCYRFDDSTQLGCSVEEFYIKFVQRECSLVCLANCGIGTDLWRKFVLCHLLPHVNEMAFSNARTLQEYHDLLGAVNDSEYDRDHPYMTEDYGTDPLKTQKETACP